jgi:hypothetical protein
MAAIFIEEVPRIAIEQGLVHIRWGDGQHSYWRPSTFRAFVENGRRTLDAFDRKNSDVVPIKAKKRE